MLSFTPMKRGSGKVLAMLKGGGVRKGFHSLKGRGGGGGAKKIRPTICPFCSPPLPVINDQSLMETSAQSVRMPEVNQ